MRPTALLTATVVGITLVGGPVHSQTNFRFDGDAPWSGKAGKRTIPAPAFVRLVPGSVLTPGARYLDFEGLDFATKGGKRRIEGRRWDLHVIVSKDGKSRDESVSAEVIAAAFLDAVRAAQGEVFAKKGKRGFSFSVRAPSGVRTWGRLWAQNGKYHLQLVDEAQMEQVLKLDPDKMKIQLDVLGHLALRGIYFDTAKATLKETSKPALEAAAALLDKYPDLRIEVAGHTDAMGAEAANLALSRRRASSVRTWLVQAGIAAGRLKAEGYGETRPVADNEREAGRAANRRVELVKLSGGGAVDLMALLAPYPGSRLVVHDAPKAAARDVYVDDARGRPVKRQVSGTYERWIFEVQDAKGKRVRDLSGAQIRGNYKQEILRIGGEILAERTHGLYFRFRHADGRTMWITLWAPNAKYTLELVTTKDAPKE